MKVQWYWPDSGTEDRILCGVFYLTHPLAERTPLFAAIRDHKKHFNVCRVDFDEEDADIDWRAVMQTLMLAAELRYAERYVK